MAENQRQYYTEFVHKEIRNLITKNETPVDKAKLHVYGIIDRLSLNGWYTQDEIQMKREAVNTFTLQ
jgi:hypothetical protein